MSNVWLFGQYQWCIIQKQASRPIYKDTLFSLLYGTDKGRRTVIYQVQIVLL